MPYVVEMPAATPPSRRRERSRRSRRLGEYGGCGGVGLGGGGGAVAVGRGSTTFETCRFLGNHTDTEGSSGGAFYLQPWMLVAYNLTRRLGAQAVYFPYLPLNKAGRIQPQVSE